MSTSTPHTPSQKKVYKVKVIPHLWGSKELTLEVTLSHITQPVDGRRKHMARSIGLQGTETPQRGSPCHPRRIPAGLGGSLSPRSLSIQSVGGLPRTFLTGVLREPQAKPGPRDHVWGSRSALAELNREQLDSSPGRTGAGGGGGRVCVLLSFSPSVTCSISALTRVSRPGSQQPGADLVLRPLLRAPLASPGTYTWSSHK